VAMSAAILAIVLIGFAPTLYLRVLFDVPPTPVYVYVHGALLTAWFVLVVVQTALIRGGGVTRHRRLGAAGVAVGVAVVVASTVVTLRFVNRILHAPAAQDVNLSAMMGFGADPPLLGLAATALWGNLTSLVTFAVLLACAVLMRRRADVHKRFMMLASLSILPPAIARISRWPGLGGDLGPLVPLVLLLLLSAMARPTEPAETSPVTRKASVSFVRRDQAGAVVLSGSLVFAHRHVCRNVCSCSRARRLPRPPRSKDGDTL
jgi:hypothetical protein